MKWFVTGGCGFVGSNLVNKLIQDGEDVTILDNLSRTGSSHNLEWLQSRFGKNFRFYQADIRNSDIVSQIVQEVQPDAIAHLAGQVAMTTSLSNPRLDFETNAGGTFNVLEAVRLNSPTTIVLYSSTNKVYGSLEQIRTEEIETRYTLPDYPLGLDESLPQDGHSPYGCSKLSADQYVRDYSRMYGIPTVVFRHSSMYGGRQYATYDQGWIGWFCQKSLEASRPEVQPFSINGNGKQVRDVLHAEDLIAVYRLAAANINKTAGKIYNIGGGMSNSLSLLELFNLLENINGHRLRYDHLESRPGDQKVFVANTALAAHDFGWSPQVSKEVGITQMLDWCREMTANE
jgi:CDP-paratose 2-epimerase